MAKTIVWIEDDIDIIEPVVRPLELAGYTFVKLRTIAEALNVIEVIRQADLVLLDMIFAKPNRPRVRPLSGAKVAGDPAQGVRYCHAGYRPDSCDPARGPRRPRETGGCRHPAQTHSAIGAQAAG